MTESVITAVIATSDLDFLCCVFFVPNCSNLAEMEKIRISQTDQVINVIMRLGEKDVSN